MLKLFAILALPIAMYFWYRALVLFLWVKMVWKPPEENATEVISDEQIVENKDGNSP